MRAPTIQGVFRRGLPRAAQLSASTHTPGGTAFLLAGGLAQIPAHGGNALPEAVRSHMEQFFGTSFADVRVHVGREAAALGAEAFTVGSHIHFAPGRYNPGSRYGQQLIAHELTHVVQQRKGRVANPFGNSVAVVHDRALEAEADRMSDRAVMLPPPPAAVSRNPAVQRKMMHAIQLKGCVVCGHKHGSSRCTTLVTVNNPDGTTARQECGCLSHSSKWDGGGKFNPGAGKRERMLARITNQ